MAAKGGLIDFMFLAPPTRPLDPMLKSIMHWVNSLTNCCSLLSLMEMVIALPTVLQQVVTAREFPCERCFTNPSLVEVDDNSPLTQNVTASTFFVAMHRNQLRFYYWLLVCYEPAILTISRDYGYFLRGEGRGELGFYVKELVYSNNMTLTNQTAIVNCIAERLQWDP